MHRLSRSRKKSPLQSSDSESSIINGSSMNRNYLIDVLTPATTNTKQHHPPHHQHPLDDTIGSPSTLSTPSAGGATMQDKLDRAKDAQHRLQLSLNTSQHDLNATLLYQRSLETKLTQVKEINGCLRDKHQQFETTIHALKEEIMEQKELRRQAALMFTNERAIHRQELQASRADMKDMQQELAEVKGMVDRMIEKDRVERQSVVSSFVVGIGVGMVSLLLPRHFFQ
jgi:small-conductance mechanosensitive channel